jgi:hypothetical protein
MKPDWAEERIGGIGYLRFLRKLVDGFETSWPTLKAAMEQMRSLLVTRAGMLCNVTINAASWRRFRPEMASSLRCRQLLLRNLLGRLAKSPAPRP